MDEFVVNGLAGFLDILQPWRIANERGRGRGYFGHERGATSALKHQVIVAVRFLIENGNITFHAPNGRFYRLGPLVLESGRIGS